MQRLRSIVLLSLGLLVGLLANSVFVCRARAQPQPQPQPGMRFQYKCTTGVHGALFQPQVIAMVNTEGAAGWKLLEGPGHHSGADQYCFVRQY